MWGFVPFYDGDFVQRLVSTSYGWYFQVNGNIVGPYESSSKANEAMNDFKADLQSAGNIQKEILNMKIEILYENGLKGYFVGFLPNKEKNLCFTDKLENAYKFENPKEIEYFLQRIALKSELKPYSLTIFFADSVS